MENMYYIGLDILVGETWPGYLALARDLPERRFWTAPPRTEERCFRLADHLAASGASRERVRITLFSAPGTEQSHVGPAHRKVLDFAYLEAPHVS